MSRTEKYKLTLEHEARLPEWRDKWIANAMATEQMTAEDKALVARELFELYKSAKLEPPKRIVFVDSPFVMWFAGGAAVWELYIRDEVGKDTTDAATIAATRDATRAATDVATIAAAIAATRDATHVATRDATDSIPIADLSHWYVVPHNLSWMSQGHLECAHKAYYMWQGGNQWSAYDSFLSFFDRVVGLDLPEYEAWRHWEQLSLHSGPRIVHNDFAIVSDRPERLLVDDQNRPHCDDGPFCRWRDGSALYAVHGVRVPAWIVENPDQITVEKIDSGQNAEIRRVMMGKYGEGKYLEDSGAQKIDESEFGQLFRREQTGDEDLVMVRVLNSTPEPDGSIKPYWIRVPPDMRTAHQAVAWTFGLEAEDYRPQVET
jgi:hypothetical protein